MPLITGKEKKAIMRLFTISDFRIKMFYKKIIKRIKHKLGTK